jgi:palmitoyltransferase
VVEEVRERRANRKNGQPWVVRKLMVVFTLGIMAYTAYVYIAQFCVKMIHRRDNPGGSRAAGSE